MSESRLTRGMYVRVRHVDDAGEWCPAFVGLASDTNPSSVMLLLFLRDAVRASGGVIVGALPVTVDYDAETVTGLTGDEYEIEVTA